MIASGHLVGKDLAEALGLNPSLVQKIVLSVEANSACVAYVKMYVTTEQMAKVTETVMLAKVAGEMGPNVEVDDVNVEDNGRVCTHHTVELQAVNLGKLLPGEFP